MKQIENYLKVDLVRALKENDQIFLEALRTIISSIQIEKAIDGKNIDDDQIIKIIQRLVKQRSESISQYTEANRMDLVNHELELIKVFKTYLPTQLSNDEMLTKAKEYIALLNASSIRDMGKVMAHANKELVGIADMKVFGSFVKGLLTV